MMDLQVKIEQLFLSQQRQWHQLDKSIKELANVRVRRFVWGNDAEVMVQFNPARIASASAKVDKKNIEKRPCFLCEANRPIEQEGISFLEKYMILCNPFPILSNHLTIPLHSHVPQCIGNKITDMLTLAEQLPDYIVFYNGPQCGASAPDHFHLQAGLKMRHLLSGENTLRTCLIIAGDSKKELEECFEDVYQYLRHRQSDEDIEPMMNIVAFVENNRFHMHIYPRKKHRPHQYFAQGKAQLLVSPGALDMAGLVIVPREEDFSKITQQDIEDIYMQVSLPVI